MKKGSLIKIGLLGLLVVVLVLISQVGKKGKAFVDRPLAWDVTLLDMDERPVKLADFRGKVLFLNFWASWADQWRDEAPIFNDLYARYHNQGFEIVSVSLDDGDKADVKPILDQMKINYKVVMGNEDVSARFRVRRLPTTYVIDRKGIIRKHYEGVRNRTTLEADIKSLLK